MTENVFIVWGRNQLLAAKVSDFLKSDGYFPVVGGMSRGSAPSTFFISSNVIQQMDDASFAIILAQRIYDQAGLPTKEFRPNLMFEWGYLQRRLRADAIHVFLIDIPRDELPSDLLNSYTHEISVFSPNPTDDQLTAAAKEITAKFLGDVVNTDFDGLEIIQNYEQYRTCLIEMAQKKRAFSAREAGYFLLHMIQPAFYRDDLAFIQDCLREFSRHTSGHFIGVAILIDQIIRYYAAADSLDRRLQLGPIDKSIPEFQTFLDVERKIANVRGLKNKVYNILDVLIEDFVGLANLELYIISKDIDYLDKSIAAFHAAQIECAEFQSIYPSNSSFIRTLWESYIERNLSRAYFYKGNQTEARRLSESGERKRISVSALLDAARVPFLSKQFQLELGLSKFDQALSQGSNEADLMEIFNRYIAPHTSSSVDRVWARLHAAVLQEAIKHGYETLESKLRAVRS
jgi:tetratricopeptide (TPR) repeat protein